MSMIHREEEEQQQQQVEQYDMLRLWEARERERDAYPRPILVDTHWLLGWVGFLKFYEGVTSLKAHTVFLRHLIHRWNAHQQAFQVSPDQWYTPTKEDIYFITRLSRRGVDFPLFLEVPASCVVGN